jgi:Spy/CpxP family protein refolding chaperone
MVTQARAKAVGVLVLVFVLGTLAGASAAHAIGQRHLAELVSEDRDELHERRHMHAMRRALDLTDDQASRIREAFRRRRAAQREAMDRMFETCGAPVEALRDQLDAEILSILTPEQQTRFKALSERHRARFPFGGGGPRDH